MSFEKYVRLYSEYKAHRENGKIVTAYKPTEDDVEAAKIAAQFPEHLLRAAVVMSALAARKEIRDEKTKTEKT